MLIKKRYIMLKQLSWIFIIQIMITILFIAGCDRTQMPLRVMQLDDNITDMTDPDPITMDVIDPNDNITDITQPDDNTIDITEPVLTKLVVYMDSSHLDPTGEVYYKWLAIIADTLQEPEELIRIRAYDNVNPTESPKYLLEFEFNSRMDLETYLNREQIIATLFDLSKFTQTLFTVVIYPLTKDQKIIQPEYTIKRVISGSYDVSEEDDYREWVESVTPTLTATPELKSFAFYDYANPISSNIDIVIEMYFENQADLETYEALPQAKVFLNDLGEHSSSYTQGLFILNSDIDLLFE